MIFKSFLSQRGKSAKNYPWDDVKARFKTRSQTLGALGLLYVQFLSIFICEMWDRLLPLILGP